MSNVLNKLIVLNLNRNWQPIGCKTVKDAFTALLGGEDGEHPALAMDFAPTVREDGSYDFNELEYAVPVKWEDWEKLPIRDYDMAVDTSRGQIRMPTIIISSNYSKMPMKAPKFSKRAVLERDNYTCQYSLEKLSAEDLNIDHVIARDKGGRNTWENVVTCKKTINSMKGNRWNHEAGLHLKKKPKAPPAIPISASIVEAKHPSWNQFLIAPKT